MGLDIKTYWLTDRQSQCDFGEELSAFRGVSVSAIVGFHTFIKPISKSVSSESSSRDTILIAFSGLKETCVGQSGFYGI
jgi:hypothetical protein